MVERYLKINKQLLTASSIVFASTVLALTVNKQADAKSNESFCPAGQDGNSIGVVTSSAAYLRNGANPNADIIDTLPHDAKVSIKKMTENGWDMVKTEKCTDGYISDSVLTIEKGQANPKSNEKPKILDVSTGKVALMAKSCFTSDNDPGFLDFDKIEIRRGSSAEASYYHNRALPVVGKINKLEIFDNIRVTRGRNIFIASKYEWDVPTENMDLSNVSLEFALTKPGKNPNYILFYENVQGKPDEVYLLVYSWNHYFNPNTDRNGQYWGIHPCSALAIPRKYYQVFKKSIIWGSK